MSESAKHEGEDTPPPTDDALERPSGSEHDKAGLLAELLEREDGAVARADAASVRSAQGLGTRVGWLVEWILGEAPKVEFAGNDRGPLSARSIIPLDATLVAAAIQDQRGVLLTFEDGRPDAPIICGLLQPLAHELPAETDETGEADEADEPEAELEARVDGRRVEIEAADEIVLRCGKASIVLRRNGRVVIRGTYVETRSRGVNRIKGGSVEIN